MKFEKYVEDVKGFVNIALGLLFMSPFIYGAFRVFAGCIYWIRFGYWREYSTCATFGMLCINDTSAIGLNIILDWFAQHDLFYVLMIFPVFGSLFFIKK